MTTQFIPTPTEIGNTAFWLSLVIGLALAFGGIWAVLDHVCDRIAARFHARRTNVVDINARRRAMPSRAIGGR